MLLDNSGILEREPPPLAREEEPSDPDISVRPSDAPKGVSQPRIERQGAVRHADGDIAVAHRDRREEWTRAADRRTREAPLPSPSLPLLAPPFVLLEVADREVKHLDRMPVPEQNKGSREQAVAPPCTMRVGSARWAILMPGLNGLWGCTSAPGGDRR